ncbi:hypothetical protein HPL003_09785 [Paenibacillus terrae HPL-003]|uniref:Uncharacterized protein n=1 Tax=Paenibacillus terrae (strain HPL-003) TaxID=985665 RepID=G7W3V8_PAETH|nr:hypothetical protein HPL003_09785 [Paenibacillus terrae HPL-003]
MSFYLKMTMIPSVNVVLQNCYAGFDELVSDHRMGIYGDYNLRKGVVVPWVKRKHWIAADWNKPL